MLGRFRALAVAEIFDAKDQFLFCGQWMAAQLSDDVVKQRWRIPPSGSLLESQATQRDQSNAERARCDSAKSLLPNDRETPRHRHREQESYDVAVTIVSVMGMFGESEHRDK